MIKRSFRIAKLTLQMVFVMVIGFGISLGVYTSVAESTKMLSMDQLRSLDNISEDLTDMQKCQVPM